MIFSTKAPELEGITGWINTKLLTMEDLKGKVVLVDFWTYTCINCLRTLPYIKEWHEKYAKHGLVIVGIHTPEFEFEKDIRNVKDAVKRHKIKHPIALDSNYEMFKAYNNHYWPRKTIKPVKEKRSVIDRLAITPETYAGSARNNGLGNGATCVPGEGCDVY